MRAIMLPQGAFHVAVQGPDRGPALVFVNSLGTDMRLWDRMTPLLPGDLRTLRFDKRGHGLSTCPPAPWSIADFAADLAGIMDALGMQAATICGLSIGGMIAQSLAVTRPDLVRALILCDTAARIGTSEFWADRIRLVETEGVEAVAEPVMARWFTETFRRERPDELALWRAMLTRTPRAGYAAACGAIRDADLTEAARALRLPTLAICGDQDGSTPPNLVRATAGLIPGARFEIVEGAGHIPCVERPEETARLIGGFLADIGFLERALTVYP